MTNANQRVGGHKSHRRKHRGADIQIDGAAPRLIVLIDGKVASQRRPELRRPNQNYVEQAENQKYGGNYCPDK